MTAAVGGVDPRWEAVELYLAMGWKIFPIPRHDDGRKVPAGQCEECKTSGPDHDPEACDHLLCHGVYSATGDPHRLARMFKLMSGGVAAIAVRTGAASGITVIDAEDYSRRPGEWPTGVEVLDDWERWAGGWSLPPTARALTQSGGVHLFYRTGADESVTSRNIVLPSIDVKSRDQYVVLPPGYVGERRWLGAGLRGWHDIAEPSPELWSWLRSARGSGGGGGGSGGGAGGHSDGYDYDLFVQEGPPPGYQNEFLNELIYRLIKAGCTGHDDLASRVWPQVQLWDNGDPTRPWTERDVRGKINSMVRSVTPNEPTPSWRPQPHVVPPTSPSGAPSNVVEVDFRGGSGGPPEDGDSGGEGGAGGPGGPSLGDADPARLEDATDTGNAHRFARILGDRVRYVADIKTWLVWDGTRWCRDRRNRALDLTLHVVDDIRLFAVTQPEEDRNRWTQHAHSTQGAKARANILTLASSLPQLTVVAEELDTDRNLLVVRNGVLDLTTGELVEPDPAKLCTLQADVVYDPEARCPRWEEHVAFVTKGDPVLAAYLRRIAGYTLTGDVREQAFFSLEGDGANGKNVFIEPIMHMLGSYATTAQSALLIKGREEHPTIIADLVGKRLVFVDEVPQGKQVDVERIKTLTGSDVLKARFMAKDFFSFPAHLKLWIAGNEQPRIKDGSDGIWRRMKRILFEAKVTDDRKIADYGRILFNEEASGILNWCLAGLEDWRQLGSLGTPAGVSEATTELQHDEDYVAVFIEERCEITGVDTDVVSSPALYAAYQLWCAQSGIPRGDVLTSVTFGKRLSKVPGVVRFEKSVRKIDGKATRVIGGVKIAALTGDGVGVFGGPAGL